MASCSLLRYLFEEGQFADFLQLIPSKFAYEIGLSADHVIFPNPEMPIVGDQDVVTVVGEYTNHYRQIDGDWKICKSELVVNYSRGNIALFVAATERALAQHRG